MENKKPIKKLFCLNKGDCFMFNGKPYIIKKTYWQNYGMLKRKIWICEMKFDKKEWCTTGNIDIYQISKDMYELLIEN